MKTKNFETLSTLEWLVTNGIGGYASSTVIGTNTRRYHGLLVAALQPPANRMVLVSKIEESVQFNRNSSFSLSSNQYPGIIHPQGYTHLDSFERSPLPKMIYKINGLQIAKTVFMVYGSNTTVIEYENQGNYTIRLELNPLFVFKDYHQTFREGALFDFYYEQAQERILKIYPKYGSIPIFMSFSKGHFTAQPNWYRNFEFIEEQKRGLDHREDAKSVGSVQIDLEAGEKGYLIFSTEENTIKLSPSDLKDSEIARLDALKSKYDNSFLQDLILAGDQFLVKRNSTNSDTIIAGYHWFTDWGRDTMIAMRGLTIASGNQPASKSIIRTFLKYLDQGMLPNRFPDSGETPEYNTIDATLWLFVVLYEYYDKFQDLEFIMEVFPALTEILDKHVNGTRYNIHTTEEGLLFGGEGLSQLTWMDARVGDFVVTPRHGCPVEINALWYNSLMIYAFFAEKIGFRTDNIQLLAQRCKSAFRQYFINEAGYLNDVIIPGKYSDDSIRPNQIYAISLPFELLSSKEAFSVIQLVEKHLYTDFGLRSLAPDHKEFKAVYEGDQWQRDNSYHQGTVWSFLWAEYALAYLKIHDNKVQAAQEIANKMSGLKQHFYHANCIHGISEIFDGLDPDSGKGCVQQAWSIGMLLKVIFELQKWERDAGSLA